MLTKKIGEITNIWCGWSSERMCCVYQLNNKVTIDLSFDRFYAFCKALDRQWRHYNGGCQIKVCGYEFYLTFDQVVYSRANMLVILNHLNKNVIYKCDLNEFYEPKC